MVSQKTRDEILLYWSGEADVTQVAKIRVLLECDPEARVYFDELAGFDVLRDRLASLSSTPSSGSFAERAVFEVSTKKNYWWGFCGCRCDCDSCGSEYSVASGRGTGGDSRPGRNPRGWDYSNWSPEEAEALAKAFYT
jgi:hypothetical protein